MYISSIAQCHALLDKFVPLGVSSDFSALTSVHSSVFLYKAAKAPRATAPRTPQVPAVAIGAKLPEGDAVGEADPEDADSEAPLCSLPCAVDTLALLCAASPENETAVTPVPFVQALLAGASAVVKVRSAHWERIS